VDGGEHGSDRWAEEAPVLAGIADAAVQGRAAFGPRAGVAVRRCGSSPEMLALATSLRGRVTRGRTDSTWTLRWSRRGAIGPGWSECRYALRPPVTHERIRLTEQGQVLLELRHRWADGTTHLLFGPVELLERLAALTPRPRINLVLY
jgi:hypothetical protein